MKRILSTSFIVILLFCFSFNSFKVNAANNRFTMSEIFAGIMLKDQGKIGNGEYFNGRGGGSVDDYKIMVNTSNREFVYCIEPGVLSVDNSQYQEGNLQLLFLEAYNARTSAESKLKNVAKLIQLVQDKYRYDNGSVETRIHYLVIQTLIWEVMCEERNEKFTYVKPIAGTTPITNLLRATDSSYLNRFNQLYDEYVDIMFKYSVIPSFANGDINKAPTVLLDQFDYEKKEYYTIIEDKNDIVKWYQLIADSNVRISIEGNKVKIISTTANYKGVVRGYNTKIRGNAQNPQTELIGHKQGSNQALVSIAPISGNRENAFFKIAVDNFIGTLSIDPNGGSYEGTKSISSYKKFIGEKMEIKIPVREGFVFSGWQLLGDGQFKQSFYTFGKGIATLKAEWSNHPPSITSPISKDDKTFIDNGDLIVQLGDPFVALNHAIAHDDEDGDITDKIIVIEDNVPVDKGGLTNQSGRYKVVYQVTDRAEAVAQKLIYVVVNEPPTIEATNRYFFVGDIINNSSLLNGVKAGDKEDGNITDKVIVQRSLIDNMIEGQFPVIFEVTDYYHKTVQKEIIVNILMPQARPNELAFRYIGKDYLGTLSQQSKWKQDGTLYQKLVNSLNTLATDETCLYVYSWNSKANETLKEDILANGQNIDLSFFNTYRLK